MTKSLDQLRRDAKALRTAFEAGELHARQRLKNYPPRSDSAELKHADYLHVIARENAFASWPALKLAVETLGMDRAAKLQRLKIAVAHGHFKAVDHLLVDTPDLPKASFGLQMALYRKDDVLAALQDDPSLATTKLGLAWPFAIFARSKMIHHRPELEADMLAIAEALLAAGGDVNAGAPVYDPGDYLLSPLYFAIGHANNMALGRWLLEHGADPNDGESLYHSTELGHHEGLKMLLDHDADPKGTNALLRAMDFHDTTAVQMLIDHGASVDEFDGTHVGGEEPWVVPAIHQAARRMAKPDMVKLILDNGADLNRKFEGCTPYAYARVFGNAELARLLEDRGADTTMTEVETILAAAADNWQPPETWIDTDKIPDAYRNILRMILHLPGKLDHIKRLVAIGVEYDRPDKEGLTPVQVAGWEGLPEVMEYFLSLKPDLGHVNGYGGTLLSTIIHGSENCPQRAERDYITCLDMALKLGVALPRRAIELAAAPEVGEFLLDWAERQPGQVVDGGIA